MSMIYALGIMACNSSKAKSMDVKILLRAGNGGGFAGKEIIYSIDENGGISGNGESFKKIKKETIEQLLSNVSVLGLDHQDYNKPGNIYNFIEIMQNGELKRLAWDPMNNEVPSNLILFHNNVIQIIKKSKK